MLYLIYKVDVTYKCSCQSCNDDERALIIKCDSWQRHGILLYVPCPGWFWDQPQLFSSKEELHSQEVQWQECECGQTHPFCAKI